MNDDDSGKKWITTQWMREKGEIKFTIRNLIYMLTHAISSAIHLFITAKTIEMRQISNNTCITPDFVKVSKTFDLIFKCA